MLPPSHSVVQCLQAVQNAPLRLIYKAEGAANVIYTLVALNPEDKIHENCAVMRMRKDLPSTKSCRVSMDEFQQSIVPLFNNIDSELLMDQILYRLTPEMVSDANESLKLMEDERDPATYKRPRHRRSVFHPPFELEEYGILMPNMDEGGVCKLVEFKPKWLLQSVSAPAGSVLCRTCALNAYRRGHGKERGRGDSGFCPFDLLAIDDNHLSEALQSIWHDKETLSQFVESFRFQVQPALRHLRQLQLRYNQVGDNDFLEPDGKDLPIAMALRDCSVFLRVALGSSCSRIKILAVKFADLDLKYTTLEKVRRWFDIEKSLCNDGAYLGQFGGTDKCQLSRSGD